MRRRPQVHFTPDSGWMNDPHGIVFVDGRYHLFFQHVPRDIAWHSDIEWGHAVSTDLIHWQQVQSALTPLPDEVGLWSGSVVLAERPTMFYTHPRHEDWGQGQVGVAYGSQDLMTWDRIAVVIDGAPAATFRDFRDPQVRRSGNGWSMVVGAGMSDGSGGCVLQYTSPDLLKWRFDGVVLTSPFDPTAALNTGEVWECPQLLQVDEEWVLLISAMELEQRYIQQLYAIGAYDGRTFTPRTWGNFGHGNIVYAATTFEDADGVPCVMAWLREESGAVPMDSPWAGAQSIVHELRIVDGRLSAPFHRNLDAVLPPVAMYEGPLDAPCRLVAPARDFAIVDSSHRVEVAFASDHMLVRVDGHTVMMLPERAAGIDLIIDEEWLEFVCNGIEGMFAVKLPSMSSMRIEFERH